MLVPSKYEHRSKRAWEEKKAKKRICNEKGLAELTEECPWRTRMQNYKELGILTSLRQSTSSGNKGNEIL